MIDPLDIGIYGEMSRAAFTRGLQAAREKAVSPEHLEQIDLFLSYVNNLSTPNIKMSVVTYKLLVDNDIFIPREIQDVPTTQAHEIDSAESVS